MGIYLPNMEMPKGCFDCNFAVDGTCVAMQPIRTRNWKAKDTTNYCPLIPVPPHGRLIDADSMEKEVCGGCVHGEHKYANCIDCALANAPTIIKAEEDER